MMNNTAALQALLRQDFKAFVRKCFYELEGERLIDSINIDLICDHLMWIYLGEKTRQIINVPPRSLKSFIVTVCFPAWILGNNPRAKLIALSYAQELAAKFSRQTRQIMMAHWYTQTFPKTRINPKKCGEDEFETTEGGFRMSTSVGGILTGRGADYIIVDDPMKPTDAHSETIRKKVNEWVDSTLFTRLDDKRTGRIIIVMQRIHSDDLTGHLQDREFSYLILPAIATEDECYILRDGHIIKRKPGDLLQPEREPLEILERLKADMGSRNFSAQYQQQPVPFDGNLLRKEWIHRFDSKRCVARSIVMSWDIATGVSEKNDYSVCTVWARNGEQAFLIAVHRMRLNFPDLVRKVKELYNAYPGFKPTILIEAVGPGEQLVQQLMHDGLYSIGIRPDTDKISRFTGVTPMFESGQVLIPEKEPWLAEFEHELLSFPSVKHDDQVDSVSQFLEWHRKRCSTKARGGSMR